MTVLVYSSCRTYWTCKSYSIVRERRSLRIEVPEDKITAELPESFDLLCHNGCLASFLRTDQGAQVQSSQQYMLHT
jgi:hypothetical protein